MDDQLTIQILDLLHTVQQACPELDSCAKYGDQAQFQLLCGDMRDALSAILRLIGKEDSAGSKKLEPACVSIQDSLRRIKELYAADMASCRRKIEFELLPLLQEAYLSYYFFQYLQDHPEKLAEYYAADKNLLCANPYIDEAVRRGQYKYDVSFYVLGYNKLEYTAACVKSLLANIPEGLRYELILVNHGSSDGTKEYFEALKPDKQLDIAVNGGGVGAVARIVEGEFTVQISNDIIITPHAIENLLACIRSDPKIAWVVPATANVSNLQTIPASYNSMEELVEFAEKNNVQDPFRWEQRVRLCNPIDIRRSSVFYGSDGMCLNGYFHSFKVGSFPDDRVSLLLRRNGYRLMLAKDAYCHHFDHITLKSEIAQQNEQQYYMDGRREFFGAFGVDPWGPGSFYDLPFMNRVVNEPAGRADILGINCGLGSNSLKIKEQLKEYFRHLDTYLCNITSEEQYIKDLSGISDDARIISNLKEFKGFLKGKSFSYIVWEDTFIQDMSGKALLSMCLEALRPGGRMFAKQTGQLQGLLREEDGWKALEENWFVYDAEG